MSINKPKINAQSISVSKDGWVVKDTPPLSRVQLGLSSADPVRTNSRFILTAVCTKPLINTLLLHSPPGTRILQCIPSNPESCVSNTIGPLRYRAPLKTINNHLTELIWPVHLILQRLQSSVPPDTWWLMLASHVGLLAVDQEVMTEQVHCRNDRAGLQEWTHYRCLSWSV